jgi:hypothetical protein
MLISTAAENNSDTSRISEARVHFNFDMVHITNVLEKFVFFFSSSNFLKQTLTSPEIMTASSIVLVVQCTFSAVKTVKSHGPILSWSLYCYYLTYLTAMKMLSYSFCDNAKNNKHLPAVALLAAGTS